MPVVICLLRGVNVGGKQIKMEVLRALCEAIGMECPQTYIQSGNVVCKTKERNLKSLAKKLEVAIEGKVKFHSDVILRTAAELKETIAKNPFAKRKDTDGAKLLVTFLAEDPTKEALTELDKIKPNPEEMQIAGRELFIYFPNGMGRSKLPWPRIGKILGSTGTGRNLNTVNKLLEMAEKL